ncbi:Maf family protein [Blastopirellula sp. JC732]|uniref:dTTP/UTP pyrophosphatase n=1 Tax=Blastopirellula sediminis TaxID=2894196 RepID=A0A9X1MTT1_9BACT|nr:nucleoside triphosphate pyrophosphatase [Blastopirellula sediminis]MCC9604431.1 Maf family protein [Blastopirellula sediminis]MCC9632270.1 Maf family protein [Blastopirellula sediminis]
MYPSLILASGSPRRRELLTMAGIPFEVVLPADHAETEPHPSESPRETVLRLARDKADDVAQRTSEGIVLAADTLAECDGQPLGKPRDRDHAREILQTLRGREHTVLTAICLWRRPEDFVALDVAESHLKMRMLSDEEIEEYLDTGLWEGKAGAFGLQDRIDWIEVTSGSQSNVVGLPLELLAILLLNFHE